MYKYFIKKLLYTISVFFAGISLIFIIIHLYPGNPNMLFLNPEAGVEIQQRITEKFGLNQPIVFQYFKWLYRIIIHWDFGHSFSTGKPVLELMGTSFLPSFVITVLATILALCIGIPAGVLSGKFRNSLLDRIITSIMLFFYSMPGFWIGIMLLWFFSIKTNLLPSSNLTSLFHHQMTFPEQIIDYIKHLILPVVTIALPFSSIFFKHVKSKLVDILNSDFILAAKSRGISENKILCVYALQNTLLPVITILGTTLPVLLSGVVLIEVIFSIPGMGRLMVNATMARDYPVVLASAILTFSFVILGNLVADLCYKFADPRIRMGQENESR